MPQRKRTAEDFFGTSRDREHQREEVLPRFRFRSQGQFSPHDLQLMKLADLDGNIAEYPWYACSAVQNDRGKREAAGLDVLAEERVCFFGLALDPRPRKVGLECRRPCRKQRVFTEMGGVKNADDLLGSRCGALPDHGFVNDGADCFLAFAVGSF